MKKLFFLLLIFSVCSLYGQGEGEPCGLFGPGTNGTTVPCEEGPVTYSSSCCNNQDNWFWTLGSYLDITQNTNLPLEFSINSAGTIVTGVIHSASSDQIVINWDCPEECPPSGVLIAELTACGNEWFNPIIRIDCDCEPTVTVNVIEETCDGPAQICFSFLDDPNRSLIEFNLGDGYLPPVPDNSGSICYTVEPGSYSLSSQWVGNDPCPIDLGDVTIDPFMPSCELTPNSSDSHTFDPDHCLVSIETAHVNVETNNSCLPVSFTYTVSYSDGSTFDITQQTTITQNGNTLTFGAIDLNIEVPPCTPGGSDVSETNTITITYADGSTCSVSGGGRICLETPGLACGSCEDLIPTSVFHFENETGEEQDEFCEGEVIFLDGSASENEIQYFIDAWRRPIESLDNFIWQAGLGWTVGEIETVNLTDLFAGVGYTFEPGFEYQIKLATSNECSGWVETLHEFIVHDAPFAALNIPNHCDDEILTAAPLVGGGTPPYSYLWHNGSTNVSIDVDESANPTSNVSYTYSVTVTDANGCSTIATDNFIVKTCADATVTTSAVNCETGLGQICFSFVDHAHRTAIEFNLGDGNGYRPHVPDNSGSVCYDVEPGTYNLSTRWGNNECPKDLGQVTIDYALPIAALNIPNHCDDEILTAAPFVDGGTPPYSYLWQDGSTNVSIQVDESANPTSNVSYTYSVTVTDANGCSAVATDNFIVKTCANATVSTTAVDCETGLGQICFSFPNHAHRTAIEFNLGDGNGYRPQVPDNSGSVCYNIGPGTYNLSTRWGNNQCPKELGQVTIDPIITSCSLISIGDDSHVFDEEQCLVLIETAHVGVNTGTDCEPVSFTYTVTYSDGSTFDITQQTTLTQEGDDLIFEATDLHIEVPPCTPGGSDVSETNTITLTYADGSTCSVSGGGRICIETPGLDCDSCDELCEDPEECCDIVGNAVLYPEGCNSVTVQISGFEDCEDVIYSICYFVGPGLSEEEEGEVNTEQPCVSIHEPIHTFDDLDPCRSYRFFVQVQMPGCEVIDVNIDCAQCNESGIFNFSPLCCLPQPLIGQPGSIRPGNNPKASININTEAPGSMILEERKINSTVKPNPFSNSFELLVTVDSEEDYIFTLFDLYGREVKTLTGTLYSGQNILNIENIGQLTPGIYTYQVRTISGTTSGKVIKH